MSYSPTIVAASLNDKDLKDSIDKLVQHVDQGTKKMVQSMDTAVDQMKRKLNELGNMPVNFGAGSVGDGTNVVSRRTRAQKEETDAVRANTAARREQTQTLDQQAAALQKATQPKSARESFYAFAQGFKEQAQHLQQLINQWESLQLARRIGDFNAVGVAIDQTTQKISALKGEITQLRRDQPTGYRDQIKERENQIEMLRQKIVELRQEQQRIANAPIGENDYIRRYREQLEQVNNAMRDNVSINGRAQQQATQTANAQQQAQAQQARAEQDIRENAERAAAIERKWRDEIRERGRVAQETAQQMIRLLHEEASAGGRGTMGFYTINGNEINAVRELDKALKEMMASYALMSDAEKDSPIGRALKRDIEIAREAKNTISAYNALALGIDRGSGRKGKDLFDHENSTVSALKQKIQSLTDQYNRLTVAQIKAGQANDLIHKFQTLTREAQILQKQLSRPVSFDAAMKLPINTLDDMAYKLRMLQSYKQGIDLTKPNAANEINKVDAAIIQLTKDLDKYMSKTADATKKTDALARSWNYMKNRLAFYFTVGASTQFIRNLIDIRSQYEMNERALGILINSAERGSQIFSELSQMALVSPYTLIELSTAAKQLTAYDVAAKDVVDTTRRLADMAAAVGIPIDRLTYALGQIKAYGYLNSRDARMFANAGIPLIKSLSEHYSKLEGRLVSTMDIYDRIKKKAIGYNDVMQVMTEMTDEGGKFFDFQAKMAGTLKVQLANLTLAWNNMLNDIGASQQGVLVSAIGGLKELFLQWKNIDKIIKTVLIAFGLWKAAQLSVLAVTGNLTAAIAGQVVMGTKLQAKAAGLAASFKSLSFGLSAIGAAFWLVLGDAIMTYNRNADEITAINKNIVDNAKETAESIEKFLESTEIAYARISAKSGKLPENEAGKAWESVREQIELTANSSDAIISSLLDTQKYDNINKRLTAAFNVLDKIKETANQLVDTVNEIDVNQDSMLYGLFGEGLAEDIQDYSEQLKWAEERTEIASKKTFGLFEGIAAAVKTLFNDIKEDLGSSTEEAQGEIEKFAHNAAQTLRDELGEEGIKDKIKVNEAIARITNTIEKQYPQITGKGKLLFETLFNDVMAEEFSTAVDKQAYYYRIFLERLKKDHASAFQDVTDDILSDTHTWSSAQSEAINKTADRIKKDLPQASQSAIDEILHQLNNTEFKLRIVTQFATTTQDEVNKQFKERFIKAPTPVNDQKERERIEGENVQKYGTLMRKQNENNAEYEERIKKEKKEQLKIREREQAIINNNQGKQDKASKAILADAKASLAIADRWLSAADEIEKWGGYDFTTKEESAAARKAQKQAESELQKTLKDEITLLDKVRSTYKTLTKDGISSTEALDIATSGYEETLASINARLSKFGLKTLDITKYAGVSNPRAVMDMLQEQLNTLLRLGAAKPAEIKDLQVKLKDLQVDSVTFDQKTLINSLNNELSKIKDEYELAVELDANPELGDMFADMFGINTSMLPRTFGDALDRAQTIINRKLAEMNITTPFDLMEGNIDDFTKSTGLDRDSAVIKELVAAQNSYRDMFKKNITETEKVLDDYIKKYGDYSDKIAEIEASRLEKLKKLNEAYYTEEMRKRPEYVAKLNAIEQGASKEKQQVDFEEFKNSRYYTMMFENLDYISTKTIRDMRDRVRELMDTMNDLTPEQLKTLMSQYEKLEQKLVKRSPFKTLTKDLKEYLSTSKERKAANQEFKNAQKEYDTQKKNVAALKEKYEQAKANSNTSKSYLDFLQIEIGGENEILQILKQQLDAAQKKADKYNLTAKLAKSEALAVAQVVGQNLQSLGELRDFLQQDLGIELSDELNGLVDGLSKVGQGINKITSSATSGDVVGVITGVGQTIYGLYDGIASIFGGGSAAGKKITKQIQDSERAVKRLELAYIDLEHAISEAYGSSVVGAKRILAVTKELELAELERQLTLEQSRKKKDRDADKILDLQKRIKELRYEISDSIREITDDLLGSDVGSFAENLVSEMAEAFKSGEDYMKVFNEKFDNMIDNMIIKSIVSKVVSQRINAIWDSMDAMIKERSQTESDNYAEAIKKREEFESKGFAGWFRETTGFRITNMEKFMNDDWGKKMYNTYNKLLDTLKVAELEAKDAYDAATQIGDSDINALIKQVTDIKPELAEKLKEALGLYWKFGEDSSESQLSALQQGIQGVTEDTAGAIEAYMNGVSQQVYLHSDLLTQIRDTIIGFNMDIQLGTLSEILLQLQNSYTIMQTMSQMMSNWTTNTGNGIRVELLS